MRFHNFKVQTELSILKNKRVLFLKEKLGGRAAKLHQKDGVSRLNFLEGFATYIHECGNYSFRPESNSLMERAPN